MKSPLRICLWSGPRNVSTALLYSFAQRPDTRAVDEPLYAHYLRVSGARHPGWRDVLAVQDNDGERVVREVIFGDYDRSVVFFKLMAHHLVDIDLGFLERVANVLLIRDPREVLPSLVNQVPEPEIADTGIALQWRLYEDLARAGAPPPVLDARETLLDPEGVLRTLCGQLGIDFVDGMLSWEVGPRPEDGIWAPHWYHNIHRSTGFQPYRPKEEPVPERLLPLLAECRPYYERLVEHAIRGASEGARDA